MSLYSMRSAGGGFSLPSQTPPQGAPAEVQAPAPAQEAPEERTTLRTACETFICRAHRELPPREYLRLEQMLQSLRRDLSIGHEQHGHICAILRRVEGAGLITQFEQLMATAQPQETSLLLLRQPCGVYMKEGKPAGVPL